MQPFFSLSTPFYRCVRSCHATMHTAANWSIDGTHLETSSRRYRYVCSFNLFARQLFICLQCRRILVDGLSVLWPTCCFHQAKEMRRLGRERGSLFFPSPPLPWVCVMKITWRLVNWNAPALPRLSLVTRSLWGVIPAIIVFSFYGSVFLFIVTSVISL